jgi:hypothetical protein
MGSLSTVSARVKRIIERPVVRFERKKTTSTSFQDVLSYQLTSGILGVSHLILSLNPDLGGSYRVQVGDLVKIDDSPIGAVFNVELPRADRVYKGIKGGDWIIVQHRSLDGTEITTEAFLTVVEVEGYELD